MDSTADRYGHERPCVYAIGAAESGRLIEIVVGTRAQAEARAAELTARHSAALPLFPEFETHIGEWFRKVGRQAAEAERAALLLAEKVRWMDAQGVHPEDREFLLRIAPYVEEPFVPYEASPLAVHIAPGAAASTEAAPDIRSLGQRLREQEADRARSQAEAARAKAERDAAEERRRRDAVRTALEAGKRAVIAAVEAGRAPKAHRLPRDAEWPRNHGVTMQDPAHPDHDLYVELLGWARANGLTAAVAYGHDGMGMMSWHELSFRAN